MDEFGERSLDERTERLIVSGDGRHRSDDAKLKLFHDSRSKPMKVRCLKDVPPMIGFGRTLKQGDIVEIEGTTHQTTGFCVAVPSECAFYDYEYFEEVE